MAKAIIEFDLDNIDGRAEFTRLSKATDMAAVLFEIQANLKKKCNHIADCQEADSDISDGVHIVFEQLQELFEEHNINVDELIS